VRIRCTTNKKFTRASKFINFLHIKMNISIYSEPQLKGEPLNFCNDKNKN